VITPGFLVVLEAGGRRLEYHTDMGRQVVLC
jgi:Xaa-Pro aminopeptidase